VEADGRQLESGVVSLPGAKGKGKSKGESKGEGKIKSQSQAKDIVVIAEDELNSEATTPIVTARRGEINSHERRNADEF
jgi:hypothetical protein